MFFMAALEVSTNAVCQFPSRQQALRIRDRALAVDPVRLDVVEPWALDREGTRDQADAAPAVLHLTVVLPHPEPNFRAPVPRRIVPDQQQGRLAFLGQTRQAPRQELGRDLADRAPVDKAQPNAPEIG